MLKKFVENEFPELNIDLEHNVNCFFIDNEAYRFLLAKKANYSFPCGQINDFEISWNKSVDQINKMFTMISEIQPHDIKNTISLNRTRQIIYQMAEPIVNICAQIKANLFYIEDKNLELKNASNNKLELAKNLVFEIDTLEVKPLPYPVTVCASDTCTEAIDSDDGPKIYYKSQCHPHCYLQGVTVNLRGKIIK